MKGHMEKDGFHPHTEYKKGTRKSRDQKVKTKGVKIRKGREKNLHLPHDLNHVHSSVISDRLDIPIDGYLGTYTLGIGKNLRIVGYKQGQTFTQKSINRIDPKISEYQLQVFTDPDNDYGNVYAINDNIAIRIADDILLEELEFGKDFGLTRLERKVVT